MNFEARPSVVDAPDTGLVLSLSDITVRFGGIMALGGVSFDVKKGEVLGIIGPNGAGKTTLFDVISGVRSPNEGRVVLDGKDVTNDVHDPARPPGPPTDVPTRPGVRVALGRGQRPRRAGVARWRWRLPRRPRTPSHTGPSREGASKEGRGDARALRARRGASRTRRIPPDWRARMVELARAIVDQPKLLLLDEPASGLDDTETARLGAQIQAVRDETDCAVLLVEHGVGFVMEQSDRVVVLNLGTVLAEGSPREIRQDGAVRDAYLGESLDSLPTTASGVNAPTSAE